MQELKSINQLSREKKRAWSYSVISKNQIKSRFNPKLNSIQVLISKVLIDSYINHEELVSVNYILRYYNEVKEGIKISENSVERTT